MNGECANTGLFGEGPADRRVRLRSILAELGWFESILSLAYTNSVFPISYHFSLSLSPSLPPPLPPS